MSCGEALKDGPQLPIHQIFMSAQFHITAVPAEQLPTFLSILAASARPVRFSSRR